MALVCRRLIVTQLTLRQREPAHACAGVIKDARLVAQCMHRFCAKCIEKWLRLSKYITILGLSHSSPGQASAPMSIGHDRTSLHSCCMCALQAAMPFCRENVCPACRKPMQSRRDCRPDPRFDHLVAVLYNDVGKYEEQVCMISHPGVIVSAPTEGLCKCCAM